jgi:hypothetical protein
MTEYTAVTPERHAKKVWKNAPDYAFAATETLISLVGAELSQAALVMPIGFIGQESGYQLVAITSLQPGMSLYVAPAGNWLGPYIPAALRTYPFRLLQQENTNKSILCVDEASGLVLDNSEDGNTFFDDQNQPTQKIKDILTHLSEVQANLVITKRAVDALEAAGLIAPWELNLKQDEENLPVTGLFRIDEVAMNELDDDAFLTLRKAGAVALAYAQLLSMNQITVLERLSQLRSQILSQAVGTSSPLDFDLLKDQGSISFEGL